MSRTLGVDYGRRRAGFAVSDPDGVVGTPLCVEEVASQAELLAVVLRIAAAEGVEKIVLGHPLNMDGSSGELAQEVETFKTRLEAATELPILLWDERLTSRSAESVLLAAGTRRKKRKQVLDKLAAQLLLQSYLDATSGFALPEE